MAEYSFQFYIDMGNSQIGSIFITNLSEPYVESSKFCAHYGLDPIVITVLGDSIREQMLIEEQECRLAQFQTENSKGDIDKSKSELRAIPLEEIDSAEMKPLRSSQNRLSNCRLGTKIQQSTAHASPVIHKEEKYNPFLSLYNQSKEMRLRKELSRKRIDGSMPFKPKINSLSKKIVEGKRKSVAHIVNTDSEKEATISQNGSYQKPSEPTIKYYVQAYQPEAKKKNENAVPFSLHSKELAQKSRRQDFRAIFHELVRPNEKYLRYCDLNLCAMTHRQRLLLPIYRQLKRLGESINQREFVEAGMRLLPSLPQTDKIILRSRSKSRDKKNKMTQKKSKLELNKKSIQIINRKGTHKQATIYDRCQIQRRKSEQKLQRLKVYLEAQQQTECRFTPTINTRLR